MSDIGKDVEKERVRIHSEENCDNPLLFMVIPGVLACLDESIRPAGYMMIGGGLILTAYDTAARVCRWAREYREN